MYFAWILPWYKLVIANVVPFTDTYRPLGSAFYSILYHSAGLTPLPFRIVAYIFMTLNIWLLYRVARLLTGSTEIAVLAALIGSYHSRLVALLHNGGTIYDILCYTFFWSSFYFYVETRQKYGNISRARLAGFCVLFTLALNSKEMAVTMPVLLLAYEWIYHRHSMKTGVVWILGIITALAILEKTSLHSPFTGVADYKLHFSMHQFMSTLRPLTDQLLYLHEGTLNTTKVLSLFALVWIVAVVSKQKHLLLCAVIVTIAPLPINFIVYRGFFVMYMPLLGWAIYLAGVLVGIREWLYRAVWKRPPLPTATWEPERIGLFLLVAALLSYIQLHDQYVNAVDPVQAQIRTLKENLLQIRPVMPMKSSVLFLRDGFVQDSFDPIYIVRLLYHDPDIRVDSVKRMSPVDGPVEWKNYNLVLDYCGGRYKEIRRE